MSANMPPKYSIKEEKSFCLYAGESAIARFDTKEEAQKELDRIKKESVYMEIARDLEWLTAAEVEEVFEKVKQKLAQNK